MCEALGSAEVVGYIKQMLFTCSELVFANSQVFGLFKTVREPNKVYFIGIALVFQN